MDLQEDKQLIKIRKTMYTSWASQKRKKRRKEQKAYLEK